MVGGALKCLGLDLERLGIKRPELIAKIKARKEQLTPEELEAVRLGQIAYSAPRHAPPLVLMRPPAPSAPSQPLQPRALRALRAHRTPYAPSAPAAPRNRSARRSHSPCPDAVCAGNLSGALYCPKAALRRIGIEIDLVAKIKAAEEELLPIELEAVRLGNDERSAPQH